MVNYLGSEAGFRRNVGIYEYSFVIMAGIGNGYDYAV